MQHASSNRCVRKTAKIGGILAGLIVAGAMVGGCGSTSTSSSASASNTGGGSGSGTKGQYKLVDVQVISQPFFSKVYEAGKAQAAQMGATISLSGPTTSSSTATDQQVADVRAAITQKVSGILLSPGAPAPLQAPVEAAKAAGIPVVLYNTSITNNDAAVATIQTNDYDGGHQLGVYECKALGNSGTVLMAEAAPGIPNLTARWKGFIAGLKAGCPALNLDQQIVGCDPSSIEAKVNAAITSNPSIRGFFGDAECDGVPLAIAANNPSTGAKHPIVGSFDTSPDLVKLLRQGKVQALVAQPAAQEGKLGVKYLLEHIQGKSVPKTTILNDVLMTTQNYDQTKSYAYAS